MQWWEFGIVAGLLLEGRIEYRIVRLPPGRSNNHQLAFHQDLHETDIFSLPKQ